MITLGSEGLFQLATSAYAREEARRNLERKAPDRLPEFSHQLSKIRLVADNPSIPCPTDLAEKDWPIYRAAHACKANGLLVQPVADFLVALGAPAASADKSPSSPSPST